MAKSLLIKKRHSWRGRSLRIWGSTGLVVLFIHWGLTLAFLIPRIGQLSFFRLHYTAEYGVDWIGGWYFIFTFPLLGLIAYLVNDFVADRLAAKYRPFAGLMIQSSFFLQIVFAAAGAMAILLNA